jgi:hypothetical protein
MNASLPSRQVPLIADFGERVIDPAEKWCSVRGAAPNWMKMKARFERCWRLLGLSKSATLFIGW